MHEHTFGLIDRFPLQHDELVLVLASALATKVSWEVPFELAPAVSLGTSPWATRLSQVLRTPDAGHTQYIAVTPDAGDVIVHIAGAVGGLIVVSVAAGPEVPADRVLATAHRIGIKHATFTSVDHRDLADLPLGEGPMWLVREVVAGSDRCIALLPAWSATSEQDLSDPSLGFQAAIDAIAPVPGPWQAGQSAMARYSRTGFEAAAATGMFRAMGMPQLATRREAQLRFAHPYAAVAITTDPGGRGSGPWHGLPVFSAWVSQARGRLRAEQLRGRLAAVSTAYLASEWSGFGEAVATAAAAATLAGLLFIAGSTST